jgi:hypothetical protein
MSTTHSHPAFDAYADAKSRIDAVTGHQPSPVDGDKSAETQPTPKQKYDEKSAKPARIYDR